MTRTGRRSHGSRSPAVPHVEAARYTEAGPADVGEREALAVALVEAARGLSRAAARTAGPGVGRTLTMAQLDLLLQIRRTPELTVGGLADQVQLARNTVSTLVGQLARAGLVARTTDPLDARVTRLTVTPVAAERMADWRTRRAGAVHAGLDAISAKELTALRRALPALRSVVSAMDASRDPAAHELL